MNEKREVVCVGWGGNSVPLYRYRDELGLPDHMRERVSVQAPGETEGNGEGSALARGAAGEECPTCHATNTDQEHCFCFMLPEEARAEAAPVALGIPRPAWGDGSRKLAARLAGMPAHARTPDLTRVRWELHRSDAVEARYRRRFGRPFTGDEVDRSLATAHRRTWEAMQSFEADAAAENMGEHVAELLAPDLVVELRPLALGLPMTRDDLIWPQRRTLTDAEAIRWALDLWTDEHATWPDPDGEPVFPQGAEPPAFDGPAACAYLDDRGAATFTR